MEILGMKDPSDDAEVLTKPNILVSEEREEKIEKRIEKKNKEKNREKKEK